MTVTHIQLLLGKRACVDKETDREKILLKFYCIQI